MTFRRSLLNFSKMQILSCKYFIILDVAEQALHGRKIPIQRARPRGHKA